MNDTYFNFSQSVVGRKLFSLMGLSVPPLLSRYQKNGLLVKASYLINECDDNQVFSDIFPDSQLVANQGEEQVDALIFNAFGLTTFEELSLLHQFFQQQLPRLNRNGNILVIGQLFQGSQSPIQAATQSALKGIVKSLAKELGRKGCNVNLVYTPSINTCALSASCRYFLSDKSAYVSGQIIELNDKEFNQQAWKKPLTGKTALVTGASRGIGAAIASCLAQDGAHVIGLDVPQAQTELEKQMGLIGGQSLLLDITDEIAAKTIIDSLSHPLDIIVHNAGITRDKIFKRMSAQQWQLVIDINLAAVANINTALIDQEMLSDDGRIVCVSSISGIAGNVGQVNYAASKAGIIGLVNATACSLVTQNKDITINAVAPGFIETEMTASIPLITRHFGRRFSSFSQGGSPSDVAHAISFLASPNAQTVNGNLLRVCGQNILGA